MSEEQAGGLNDGFVQEMHERFQANPQSVDGRWREIFANAVPVANGGKQQNGNGAARANGNGTKTAAPPASPPQKGGDKQLPEGATPLRGPAAGLVKNMSESLTVPTATSFRTLAVATLDAQRKQINRVLADLGDAPIKKLSFTHIVAWAIITATRNVPGMNHAFETIDGKPYRIANPHVNFGLAVDVEKPDGNRSLVVPVVHGAEAMTAIDFFHAYDELVKVARAGKLTLDQMMGANVTLTNPGGIGTVASVPRLMAHQGTIVATGSIAFPVEFQHLPAAQLAELGVAKTMTMTSTYDHRVIQGAQSGAFLKVVDDLLQGADGFYEELQHALGLTGNAKPVDPTPAAASQPITVASNGAKPDVLPERDPSGSFFTEPGSSMHIQRPGPEPKDYLQVATGLVSSSAEQLGSIAAAMSLVKAYRTHGHLAAHLDPLGTEPIGDPSLDPASIGLTDAIMATIPASILRVGVDGETLKDALPSLRQKYCGTIAYEIEHLSEHSERVWLRRMIESGEHLRPLDAAEHRTLLERLSDVETFERFVLRAYLGHKQFSIEGCDMMVPMLDEVIEMASQHGAHQVALGMAHRGRLNVLTNVIGRPVEALLREFEAEGRIITGTALPKGGTGDVKYHQGAVGEYETSVGPITVAMAHNPSHLEAVDPIIEGYTRAEQTLHRGSEIHHDCTAALAVLIHGDAAFTGQGIVAETLNMGDLPGYWTGGTLHLITNNQLGYTTTPREGRSTRYASDLAKGFDAPIIHVNADDPESCLGAVRLAMAFRNRFHRDVVVDLVGYRRHGHNEADEPAYTQPRMYAIIKDHPSVRELYAARLAEAGVVDGATAKQIYDERYEHLGALHEQVVATAEREPVELNTQDAADYIDLTPSEEPTTPIAEQDVLAMIPQLLDVPEDFTVHPKLARQLARRLDMPEKGFDWGTAEALALGSLLKEGVNIRMTGQDTERGTFAHRQMVLHDVKTGEHYTPIDHLEGAQGALELHNSPLSEAGCLGFEFGYSTAFPEALVIWEAQFGDFVNGAQIVIDQFLMSGLSKWGATTRLTLLLPHGYEGNGPEHSYARLDRFLAGAAEGNVRIANCTSSAQFFHLMRRQALIEKARPLIVMTPKSLLRAPFAMSTLSDFTTGRFEWVIDDPKMTDDAARAKIKRLVICSGKVYYDIVRGKQRTERADVAVTRLELLYPFPKKQLSDLLASYPNLREVVWAQEEPKNMGAYTYVMQRIPQMLPAGADWSYVGRPKRSSPSEGYTAVHVVEQKRIVNAAFG